MPNKSTFYQDTLPKLKEKYELALEQCLEIIGRPVDADLADDKMFNVLKGKKEAGEQVKFYAKEIDTLENEINGIKVKEETEKPKGAESFTEQ